VVTEILLERVNIVAAFSFYSKLRKEQPTNFIAVWTVITSPR